MLENPVVPNDLRNAHSVPISLQRLRVDRGRFPTKTAAQIARQVDETEVSQPPIWRKGPVPAINPGWPCWVLTFDNWPKCVIHEALVQHVDLTERLYIVTIKTRKWAVSAERVFSVQSAAQQEAALYETINQALYLTPADGACKDECRPPLPRVNIFRDLKTGKFAKTGETTDEC